MQRHRLSLVNCIRVSLAENSVICLILGTKNPKRHVTPDLSPRLSTIHLCNQIKTIQESCAKAKMTARRADKSKQTATVPLFWTVSKGRSIRSWTSVIISGVQ